MLRWKFDKSDGEFHDLGSGLLSTSSHTSMTKGVWLQK